MSTSPVIRLTLTPEIQEILDYLKQIYPLLNDAEILKLALGGFYQYVRPASSGFKIQNSSSNEYELIKQKIAKRVQNKFSGVQFSQEEIDANTF